MWDQTVGTPPGRLGRSINGWEMNLKNCAIRITFLIVQFHRGTSECRYRLGPGSVICQHTDGLMYSQAHITLRDF